MKKMVRWLQVLTWSTLFSVLVNLAFYTWMVTNPYPSFLLSERLHVIDLQINDFFGEQIINDEELNSLFHSFVDAWNPTAFVDVVRELWVYNDDAPFWDVPTHPIFVFAELKGDCDDYARLVNYVLHRRGYETYYVALARDHSRIGHAVCIYFDPSEHTLYLADINIRVGLVLPTKEKEDATYILNGTELCELVRRAYPREYDSVSVRDWSATKLLYGKKL